MHVEISGSLLLINYKYGWFKGVIGHPHVSKQPTVGKYTTQYPSHSGLHYFVYITFARTTSFNKLCNKVNILCFILFMLAIMWMKK